jgi:Spy/CpxP family protein refolding chaperone
MEDIMKLFLVAAVLFAATTAYAQSYTSALMRQDIKSEKTELMAGSLPLTEKQAEVFWPIYRDYDHELSKLADKRLAVAKEASAKYDTMDKKTAARLVKESFSVYQGRNKLLQKYYTKVSKAIGVIPAARFLQVENQMLTLLDAQLMDEVPLIKVKAGGETKK